MGGFEFVGSSLDHTPPTIVNTSPVTINDGGTNSPISQFQVTFSEALNPIDAGAPAVYELREAGSNGFGSPDDVVYALMPIYTPGSTVVTLDIDGLEGGTLPAGDYQFTIFSTATTSIHDLSGNALDGDDNGTPGGDYVKTFTINATATTTVVTPGTTTVASGQSATFTATVSSSNGTPTDGFVQFLVDGIPYGNPVPLSGGSAKLAITEPGGSSYTIAARYTGDSTYGATVTAGETTATLTVTQSTVVKTATSTAVTPNQLFVAPGQSATFTATVSSTNGAPPDGFVQFLVDGLNYGSPVALTGGKAKLAITEPLGTYTIAAQYTGDANFAATLLAAEATATLTVSQSSSSKVATTTVVTPSTDSVGFGQSVLFAATVSSLVGTPSDGSIQFLVNGSDYLSPVPVSGGKAQLSITEPAGTYTIAAQYTGDAVYAATVTAAETTATLTFTQLATSTSISPGTDSVSYGQSPSFTATVSSTNGTPSDGFVQFLANGSPVGNTVPVSKGMAQLAIAEAAGSYTITAQYLGDANYAATLANAESSAALTVTPASTTTALTPLTLLVAPGQSGAFTAAVTSPAGTPTDGSVQFLVDGANYGNPVMLSGGKAQVAITEPAGSYSITAEYTGDGTNYASSPVSALATLIVAVPIDTSTALKSSADPSKLGDSVTFTATVSPTSGNVTPTGTVQFSIDGSPFGNPVSLTGGMATITTTSLAVGSHTVSTGYTSDNGLFNPSSGALTGGQEVDKADVTVGLTVDHSTSTVGQTVTFTVTVDAVTSGLPAPTGSVTLSEGATDLGSATLSNGQATIMTSALPVGDDAITASYAGDGNFNQNTSAAFADTITPVLVATSIASVSPSPRATPVSSIDVTFNVPINASSLMPGSVTLTDDGNAVDVSGVSLTLVAGTTATYSIGDLSGLTAALGAYTLTVNAGDIDDQNGAVGTGPPISTSWRVLAAPTITWATPADIVYGTKLNSTQLDATANVPGTFTYSPAADTILGAGNDQTLSVSFVPTDTTDYADATGTVTINVLQAMPTITWAAPADIVYGTPLSTTQLDATANVSGTFTYTPASSTILNAGDGQTLSVSFAPTDSIDYTTATAQTTINVQLATLLLSGLSPSQAIFAGTGSSNLVGTLASNTSAVPPGDVSITIDGITQAAAVEADGSFSTTFNTQAIPASDTPYTITYAYAGGTNFQPASDASTSLTVIAAAIVPVSPDPRNTPVANINLTFDPSILTVPLTSADLSLTDNGGPNLISGSVAFTRVTSDSYIISGLSGLTAAEGTFSLTLNADGLQDQAGDPITGSISTSWLMDTTAPTSTVSPLPQTTTSTSFTVTVTGSDPTGSNGSTPSGIASFAVYDQTDGGAWTYWKTLTPSNGTSNTASATFTGSFGNTYGFYSVATDRAGNVQSTPTAAQTTIQIVNALTITSIAAVTPNPRNSAVASIDVTFSEPINTASVSPGALTLTDDGGANLIEGGVSLSLVGGSTATYAIGPLTSLTTAQGEFTLTVNAADITDPYGNPGTGSLSTFWLVDTTPPTSQVNALAARETSLSFAVTVTGSDPNAANGGPASGVANDTIFVSINGGAWSQWTVAPASNPTATYTGASNTTYSFYSIARDNAGNVENKAPAIEASTYLPDLTPPVTAVDATTGTNPSTVNSTTGTFTLDLTGNDPGGAALTYFEVFVSIDGGTYQEVGPYAIPAGFADSHGNYHSTIAYQGLTDGQSHTYSFYSIGLDSVGNLQGAAEESRCDLCQPGLRASPARPTPGLQLHRRARQREPVVHPLSRPRLQRKRRSERSGADHDHQFGRDRFARDHDLQVRPERRRVEQGGGPAVEPDDALGARPRHRDQLRLGRDRQQPDDHDTGRLLRGGHQAARRPDGRAPLRPAAGRRGR